MKKLGKLSITPEKVLKNEELVNLRGGYDETGTNCPLSCGSACSQVADCECKNAGTKNEYCGKH